MPTKFQNIIIEFFDFLQGPPDSDGHRRGPAAMIETGTGWYRLISDMCVEVQDVLDSTAGHVSLSVSSISEEHGALSLDYTLSGSNSAEVARVRGSIDCIAAKYEDRSKHVCEECGKGGLLRMNQPWQVTLCDDCFEEEIRQSKKRFEQFEAIDQDELRKALEDDEDDDFEDF